MHQSFFLFLACATDAEDVDTSLDFSNTSATVQQVNHSTQQSILIPTDLSHLGMYVVTNYSFTSFTSFCRKKVLTVYMIV